MTMQENVLRRQARSRSRERERYRRASDNSLVGRQPNHSCRQCGFFYFIRMALLVATILIPVMAFGQVDQGAITGIVVDKSGAIIPGAIVKLSASDTGLAIQTKSNQSGNYIFSPIKIGSYAVRVSVNGFQTLTRENLHVDAQQRLEVELQLTPGEVSQTITVTGEAPLLQNETSGVGQTIDTETINNTPLNGRNWVYIAQLTAGAVSASANSGSTRGSGTGDFVANGQRAEQNNFILDGVDNNSNLTDFLNGASFVIRPPPDALSEFSIQTSNFSAEFGHSAGAVMSASIKSGTNQIHGNVWEYVRNTNLDATPWNAQTTPPYHQNQFGATLGLPIWRNKLFYFGDIEANRIAISNPNITTVPTPLMRQGDFSELLNTSLTDSQPVTLYQPNSADPTQPLTCNGKANVFCQGQINPIAQNILKLYPQPNVNNGKTYNNYNVNLAVHDDTIQWDQRLDWNVSASDQAYARFSYAHEQKHNDLPLGPLLDGSGYGGENDPSLFMNFMASETHIFNPRITNEFRFGYNWGRSKFIQAHAYDPTVATSLGLGGVPAPGPGQYGLPYGGVSGINSWGSEGTNNEGQNVYQILDNATWNLGNHSFKFGVTFQSVRFAYLFQPATLGLYYYNGSFTGVPGVSFTGNAVADFLADQMSSSYLANAPNVNDAQWYRAGYVQDDWKLTQRLTLNLGLRYDYFQPYKENGGQQANFVVNGPLGLGTGSAIYQFPQRSQNVALGTIFPALLAKDNVAIQFIDNERLAEGQKSNFAPRVGFAFQTAKNTVVRSGFGIFYGGLMSEGNTNLGANFPYSNEAQFIPASCVTSSCPSLHAQGISLEQGVAHIVTSAGGLQNYVSYPSFHAADTNIKTPYTMNYSLSVQQAISPNMAFTISYVGNVSRHLSLYNNPNTVPGLFRPGTNTQPFNPFPDLGGIGTISYAGVSTYNSLQTKVEKRYSRGLSFLATYTWAHALDDASDAGGNFAAVGSRNQALIPFIDEYTNSVFDVRHRFTINGNYEFPVGKGRKWLNNSRLVDETIGNWSTSLTWAAQSGTPYSVSPNISTAAGGGARAFIVGNPDTGGGTPNSSNSGITCPAQVHTKANWFNPCALANPLPGETISDATHPVGSVNPDGVPVMFEGPVRDTATAIRLLGGLQDTLYGPGYYQVNMSLFKTFPTWREQNLQFRADAFNVLNHPTWGAPGNGSANLNNNGGQITGPKFFQNNTPDARFFQLSLKYAF
jgi:Carboxypeptidase regulatory-like domain